MAYGVHGCGQDIEASMAIEVFGPKPTGSQGTVLKGNLVHTT
jgi:hypothetical protein